MKHKNKEGGHPVIKAKRILSFFLVAVMIFSFSCTSFAAKSYPDARPLPVFQRSGKHIADLLTIAKSQIGYVELDPTTGAALHPESQVAGYTKYGASFGEPRGEWCAYFVSWCATNAGIPTSVVPRLGNCARAVEWYKANSTYKPASSGYIPSVGDIIFFNWSGGSVAKHIGIVTGVNLSKKVVYTIEGNTGAGRGNQCMSKERSMTAGYIVGYGVPSYNDRSNNYGSQQFANNSSYSGSSNYAQLSVVTTSATEITATSAKLHGEIKNSAGLKVSSAGFLFGSDKTKLTMYPVVSSTNASSIKLELDIASKAGELLPNTTYYYRSYVRISGKDYPGPMYAVVTVNDKPQQLMLSEISTNVGLGQTITLMATPLPYGTVSKGFTWTSSDEKIVTVTNEGVVKGINYGTATLTATTNYGSVSAACNVTVLIPTPENLSLTNKSERNITLKWDAVEGAEGYAIYRNSDMDSEPYKFAQVSATETEFEDTSVEPGEKYYYRVMALAPDEIYNSKLSSAKYTTARLSAPQGVTSARDGVWIDVTWDEVDGAKGYLVYRSTSPDGLFTNIGKAYTNKYVDRDVLSAQLYYYKIVADNGNDRTHSDFSAVTSTRAKFVSSAVQNENSLLSSMQAKPVETNEVRIVRSRTDIPVPSF